jgi:membrane protein required for colicin V production
MTLVDWIIVVLLALATLHGLARGFFRSVFSLVGLLLGLALAAWNYGRLAHFFRPMVSNDSIADAIAFLVIALLVMVLASILGSLLSNTLHKIGLGCLDRLAGAVFGLFEGIVFVTVCILVTVAFLPQTHWLTESKLPRRFFAACHLSTHVSPEKLAARVRKELKTLEEESPPWMHSTEVK